MENYNRSCEEYVATQEQEGDAGKKYGGLVPKKKPLISKAKYIQVVRRIMNGPSLIQQTGPYARERLINNSPLEDLLVLPEAIVEVR
ncbi:hypothetical protein RHGRI_012681 [Rhododendron griersonianum]|uniref:Uncharacterized protein n=1 Tax=Rhododendron griersonianum TaxID=479676 RepID=A0AAV6KS26_9ERIC|nr:hypothetical protein RHGRI_012681 [Rhododendron griersonianum]